MCKARYKPFFLVMEKPDACKAHCNAVFVAGLDDIVISYGAAGLSDIFNTASVCALDIVTEGEECVGSE